MELYLFIPAKNIAPILVTVEFFLQMNFNIMLNSMFSKLFLYTNDWE